MRTTYITASLIATFFVLWLISGQLRDKTPPPPVSVAKQNEKNALMQEEKPPLAVRVTRIYAQPQVRRLSIRGSTQSKRVVSVRSQISGTLAERAVERGDRVKAGQLLCRISVEDREVAIDEAKQALNQAQIEFDGSQRLSKSGLQSETAIAQAKSRLASARANMTRSSLAFKQLAITAPFGGLVEDVDLELGDYVTPGAVCAVLVDLDPMLLVGQVPEKEIASLTLGDVATAELASGVNVSGAVTFIGKTAEQSTRTYPIEIQVENADYQIPSGISAQIHVPVEHLLAHRISPSLLALDDEGNIGVRTVDANNVVEFHIVKIVSDDNNGIWISGLPEVSTIITVGQELVVAGETVAPTFEGLEQSSPAVVEEPGVRARGKST